MPDQPSKVLFVEGDDDEHVVGHICNRSEQMPNFRITRKNGINPLLASIKNEARNPGLSALGIVIDADDNVIDRWKAVTDQLQQAGVNSPRVPEPTGTIINGPRRVGIWLMPDNISPGELEDFIKQMIPPNDPIWPMSETYIDNIPQKDRIFTEGKVLRAKVHAWLATRKEPRRMGAAIGAHDLNIDVPIGNNFVAWLKALFI